MKKILSVLLVLIILSGTMMIAFTGMISASAQTDYTTDNYSGSIDDEAQLYAVSNDYIFYTDLFYGYAYYLENDSYLKKYNEDIDLVYNTVYDSYQNSAAMYGTAVKYAFDTVTSPSSLGMLITDTLGLTDFSYNDALDAANEAFIDHYFDGWVINDIESELGKPKDIVKNMKKMVDFFNELELQSDTGIIYTAEFFLQEAFDFMWDNGLLEALPESVIWELWDEINDSGFSLKKYFKLATTELEIAEAIVTCVMLEDFKLDIIDEIIKTQTSDTILKQGMQRLRNKASGNFVDIFIKSYIKDEIADKVAGAIDKFIIDTFDLSHLNFVLKAINGIVFDLLWDVPEYCDVIALQVLKCYSNDLSTAIKNKANSYRDGNAFSSEQILGYEALCTAYNAANKGMIAKLNKICDIVNPYEDVYQLFEDAAAKGIKNVVIKDNGKEDVYSSTIPEAQLISILDQKLYSTSSHIYINNGIQEKTVYLRAIACYCAMSEGIETVRTTINNFDDNQNIFENHIKSVKTTIMSIPEDQRVISKRDYYLNGTVAFRAGSDEVKEKSIYAVNDKVYGNIYITGNTSVDFSLNALSNLYINKASLTVNGELNAHGNVDISNDASLVNNGNSTIKSVYLQTMNYYAGRNSITNNKTMTITDTFDSRGDTYGNVRSGYRLIQNKSDAVLYIGGDFYANTWDVCETLTGGTVCFNGDRRQNVKNLRAYNLVIDNPESINYLSDINVYGLFDTNGYTLYTNGYANYINNTTRFIEGYNYKRIRLASNVDLWQSVKADVYVNECTIYVPGGCYGKIDGNLYIEKNHITVDGGLEVTGLFDVSNDAYLVNNGLTTLGEVYLHSMNYYAGRNSINNHGIMVIRNKFESCGDTYANVRSGYRIVQERSNAVLYLGGDFYANTWDVCETLTDGAVYINGTNKQTINNLMAPTIVIENESSSGVVFNTSINPWRLFNHNGNKFTLSQGGTFVDYDGDGKKDNVDPDPVTGNPCVANFKSNNSEYGSVSDSSVNTYGGKTVTVTATPTSKYEFVKWIDSSGNTVSTSATHSFFIKNSNTYTAIFAKRSHSITVKAVGGIISVPSSATIESLVYVNIAENPGYNYVEGSLMCDGVAIENGTFIMPDYSVVVSATFEKNDWYFVLADEIEKAEDCINGPYTIEGIKQLQNVVSEAQKKLNNDISEEDSTYYVQKLQEAMSQLETEYLTLYFEKPEDWKKVNYYAWGGMTKMEWPGEACTYLYDNIWCAKVPKDTKNIIFNDEVTQTYDLSVTSDKLIARLNGGVHVNEYGNECPTASWYKYNEIPLIDENTTFEGTSLTVSGNVGVNFHMTFSEELINDGTARVVFTLPNGVKKSVPVNSVEPDEDGYYVFTCGVAAKEMTSEIKAQVVNSRGEGEVYSYSVIDYARYILQEAEAGNTNYTDAAPLVKAMLNYGAAAQEFFGHKEENLANSILDDSDKVLAEDIDLSAFKPVIEDGSENVSYYGSALSLNSETTIKHYFRVNDEENIPEFYVNNQLAKVTEKDGLYEVRVEDIPAQGLDEEFVVTADGLTLSYNAFSYGYYAMQNSDAKLQNIIKALYAYNQTADAYIANTNA